MSVSKILPAAIVTLPLLSLSAVFVGCGSDAPGNDSPSGPVSSSDGGDDAPAVVTSPTNDAAPTQEGPCALAPLRNVFWGDLHVHTAYSLDSYVAANRNDPVTAYAFAQKKGQISIGSDSARHAEIDRKLDFAVVTDHSEFLDVMEECINDSAHPNYGGAFCTSYRDNGATSPVFIARMAQLLRPDPSDPTNCDGAGAAGCVASRKTAWQRLQAAAKAATQSDCSFTALIGYEWTAQTGGNNLHRNVFFGSDVVPDVPLDYIHYPKLEDVWAGLDAQCTGACKALTVPHNSNASNGVMWNEADTSQNHEKMRQYQRLVEVYQHKGNSECFPGSGGVSDPECLFEASGNFLGGGSEPDPQSRPGFVREGLARGLEIVHGKDATTNPLALGFLGSTDTHNGAPGYVFEGGAGANWQGHLGDTDSSPAERIADYRFSPGGITGVWARNNTREELFAGLQRRETYATSGPRITLRFHARAGNLTQEQADAYCNDLSYPSKLEADGGVPMGSDLATGGDTWLFVLAAKDATDLDSFDIVDLRTDGSGKAVSTRNEVSLGTNGAMACRALKMNPLAIGSHGLVYARVFEKETWRWSHYDCADPSVANTAACDPNTPAASGGVNHKIRERAWSSPIFLR